MIKLPENIYWKKFVRLFKFIGTEFIVLFLLLLSINNYLRRPDDYIGNGDGKGYYDYLPSIFIRHDINRKDFSITDNPELFQFSSKEGEGFYVQYENKYVNKYPCGTALLQLPFFLAEFWTTTYEEDNLTGYEHSFHTSVFHAALFYLFLALFFMKLFLRELKVKIWIIFFIQLLVALGTNVTFYTSFDASFSHVYSLFAVNAFVYVCYKYFNTGNLKFFIWACVLLGLILNLRQVNLLVIFVLPFIAGSWFNLKQKIVSVFKSPRMLFLGIGLMFAVAFIQFYLWYLQTGFWLVYSYQGESFVFTEPHMVDILFSYKKGLFLYTPIALIVVLSSIWMIVKKKYYLFSTWALFFVFLTYVLSSWWSWYYGCSFGHRAFIEYYGLMFIPFALFLNQIKIWMSSVIIVLSLVVIPLNLIQTYQYSRYIMHWINMDEQIYWDIFLRTDEKYEGMVWVEDVDLEKLNVLGIKKFGQIQLKDDGENVKFQYNIAELDFNFSDVNFIIIKAKGSFDEEMTARVRVFINDMRKGNYYYFHEPFIIHFAHGQNGTLKEGYYKYAIPTLNDVTDEQLEVLFFNSTTNKKLEDVELIFCTN